jgi:methyl-accepting chemotaxis protein
MRKAVDSINEVSKSANELLNVIQMINQIAGRTNLLAMNASIEAAHAGTAGKGFAVVAIEIRKLAEETAKNTVTITDTLKKNNESISKAVEINRTAGEYFHKINTEVQTFADAMMEINAALNQMSVGTKDVITAVSSIVDSSEKVKTAIADVDPLLKLSASEISEIFIMSSRINERVSDMIDSFQSIIDNVSSIDIIGERNIDYISKLTQEISNIEADVETKPDQKSVQNKQKSPQPVDTSLIDI